MRPGGRQKGTPRPNMKDSSKGAKEKGGNDGNIREEAAPKKGGDWRGTAGDNDWAPDQRRDWRDRGDWDRSWEKWRDNRW